MLGLGRGGRWGPVGRWAVVGIYGSQTTKDGFLSVLLPTEISSVTAQAAEPRVSGQGLPGGWGKKEEAMSLTNRTSRPPP